MNRDAKNISRSLRPQIEMIKTSILTSAGRWFDADGYTGKTALRELRASGLRIPQARNGATVVLEMLASPDLRQIIHRRLP